MEQEPLEHAPAWYKLLSDCVRQNPEKRPASAGALVSRLKAFDDNRQAEEGQFKKEQEARERAKRQKAENERKRQTDIKRQAQEQNRQAQQQTAEKQEIGSQVKPSIIGLALLGLGFILSWALVFIIV
ncbi:MAG: hypothetical protein ABFS56_13275 [Pseudomonadota bacterium]